MSLDYLRVYEVPINATLARQLRSHSRYYSSLISLVIIFYPGLDTGMSNLSGRSLYKLIICMLVSRVAERCSRKTDAMPPCLRQPI